ncbi:MAG: SGNH/GDSL hydrolase family protein [Alkalispirochaeta sp.]
MSRAAIRIGQFTVVSVLTIIIVGAAFESVFSDVYENLSPSWHDARRPVELAILGSSQAQHAYNPLKIEEQTGLYGYNLGSAGQKPDSTYFLLRDFLATELPEVIVLDMYWRTLEGELDFSQLARNYEKISDSDVRRDFFRDGFPLSAKIIHTLPILKYRQDFYWFLESSLNRLLDRADEDADISDPPAPNTPTEKSTDFRGYRHTTDTISERHISEENKFRNYRFSGFNRRQVEYLRRIVELARQRNIDIVVVSAPILPQSLDLVADYDEIAHRLDTLFRSLDVPYIDLNREPRLTTQLDASHFSDENHLNAAGATLVSEWISSLSTLPPDRDGRENR